MFTIVSAVPLILLAILTIALLRYLSGRNRDRGFPGPKPLPVIGNLHQLPKSEPWRTWKDWGKKYGPIVQVTAFSQTMIIINTHRAAMELLTERGQIYSGRPYWPMACGECGVDRNFGLSDPGPEFKETRKMIRRILEGKMVNQFKNHVESETLKTITRIHTDSANLLGHIRNMTSAIILLITHGYAVDPRPNQDPFTKLAVEAVHVIETLLEPGRWWIDMLPILKYAPSWLPGGEWRQFAERSRGILANYAGEPHAWVKQEMAAGRALRSCTRMLLEDPDTANKEDLIMWGMAALHIGGSDTTASIDSTFFLAMSCHPEIVARAQKELDSVLGSDRLPAWEDRASLPYLEAIVTEVMRYAPPAPLGLPHKATADGVHEGRFISKGTMIFANIWGMTHDEEIFPRPFEFDPERYLEKNAVSNGSEWTYVGSALDPRNVIFGYGRRYCPGRDLALMEVWYLVALSLQVFDIKSIETPAKRLSEYKFVTSTLSHPPHFDCIIRPRSKAAETLLQNIDHPDVSLDFGRK